jgi:hypothetical protein
MDRRRSWWCRAIEEVGSPRNASGVGGEECRSGRISKNPDHWVGADGDLAGVRARLVGQRQRAGCCGVGP